MAKLLCVSLRTLERRFQREVGISPRTFFQTERVHRAAELIKHGARTKEVAYLLDYKYPPHFCRAFKRHYGVSPKVFFHTLSRNGNLRRLYSKVRHTKKATR